MAEEKNNLDVEESEYEALGREMGARVAEVIDLQLGRISAAGLLGLGLGAMALSFSLAVMTDERKGWATFVGSWVPALVGLAVYGKLVQLEARLAEEPAERPVALHH